MSSFRRTALLLALGLAAATAALAQSSSQDSDHQAADQSTGSSSSTQAHDQAQPSTGLSSGEMTVQARIRARRAQRRAAAIRDAYDHLYEAYGGMGYLRFVPGAGTPATTDPTVPHGPMLERAHEYAWDTGLTRYFNERLGATVDGRGYYATAYVGGPNNVTGNAITNAAISEYAVLAGPTYRFYLQPKYSVSGRVMAGFIHGNFSGDTDHSEIVSASLGLWPDETTYAASASMPVEYNMTPRVSVRVVPEYFLSGFGSTAQNSLGFTIGFGYRFGKQ